MRQIQDGTILRDDQHYENCVCNDRGEFRDDMWGQRFDLQTLDDGGGEGSGGGSEHFN